MLIGPGLFSLTFAFFIAPGHRLPAAPWYLAAALLVVSLVIAWRVAAEQSPATTEITKTAAEAEAG